MFFNKEVAICTAVVLALSVACTARPNQNERRIKSTSAQDLPSKLPDGGTKEKAGVPTQVFYDVPATVREVDEHHFRLGKQVLLSEDNDSIRRRIQRYEKVYNPQESDGIVWTSLTNVVEYGDGDQRFKRSLTERSEEVSPKTIPLKKLKRDDLHIVRIKVGRGGVAIAGPGGVASAGTGGTAIVGPGGSAYTEADGTAVVGPGAKLYQIPDSKSRARGIQGYKLIATGPFVFQPTPKNPEPRAFF